MRLPDEPETPFEINIVPMIDVIFSILAFFIISTGGRGKTGDRCQERINCHF